MWNRNVTLQKCAGFTHNYAGPCLCIMAAAGVFVCPVCATFEAPSLPFLLSHLRLVHSHDPRFSVTCGLDGCTYTSRSFSALYSHIYRKHRSCGAIQPRFQDEPFNSLQQQHTGSSPVDDSSDSLESTEIMEIESQEIRCK